MLTSLSIFIELPPFYLIVATLLSTMTWYNKKADKSIRQ